jgi:hypothetical protein
VSGSKPIYQLVTDNAYVSDHALIGRAGDGDAIAASLLDVINVVSGEC